MRSIIAAFIAIIALSGCATERTLGGTFRGIGSDATLKSKLFADRRHDYSDIDLTLSEGRLLLTGTMRSEEGRAVLVERARVVKGVKEVIDEVIVSDKTSRGQGWDDSEIDRTLKTRWMTARGVDSRNYKVSVSQGVVYVIGRARDDQELQHALAIARDVKGVSRVVSYVNVLFPTRTAQF
jgi:osmotically-inducible protein OsmY